MSQKKIHKLKSGIFSRSFSLAKITLETGTSLATQGLKQVLKNKEEKKELWREFLKREALNLTSELGELKGSLMKAGQMLSMLGEHFLPPEANEFLKQLQSQSPSLSWEPMLKTLKKELSPEQLDLLEIDPEPLAAASLGQVHRAKRRDTGEWLALKIQYPGVERAIDSDLRAIKTFLSMLKLLPRDVDTAPLFEEVRSMLIQETDYEIEAKLMQAYQNKLGSDPRYVIPKLHLDLCNKRILATSLEEGVRADDPIVKNLSPEDRNELAKSFLDLYFKELFSWGFIQTDAHLGNYKIRINENASNQIILLDFGATRAYSEDFLKPYHLMIKSALNNDKENLLKASYELGFLKTTDSDELKNTFIDFCYGTVEPFLTPEDPRSLGQMDSDGFYDWQNTDLPKRLSKKVWHLVRNFKARTPPKEVIFIDRKTGGVFIFLSVLGAKFKARDILLKYLK